MRKIPFSLFFPKIILVKNIKNTSGILTANKTTKTNLLRHKYFPDVENFNRNLKYFETPEFFSLLRSLLPVDYALLIQRNRRVKVQYGLTHFHVRVDWPIADASEDLGLALRYISKELYEKGDKYAEVLQKKII